MTDSTPIRPSILIYGAPCSGKTTSLRSLSLDKKVGSSTLYINGDNKCLPWFGKNYFKRYTVTCPTFLPTVLESVGSGEFETIVIDTLDHIMATFQSRFVGSALPKYTKDVTDDNYVALTREGTIDGQAAWGRYGSLLGDILRGGNTAQSQMIYFTHLSLIKLKDNSFIMEAPLSGSVGRAGLLGYFTLAFIASYVPMSILNEEPDSDLLTKEPSIKSGEGRYVFQVAKTSFTQDLPIRAIIDLFGEGIHYIDADILKLNTYLDSRYAQSDTEISI